VVKLLLATDPVDPDSKDSQYGRTPLSWAAKNGQEAVVKQLLATDRVDPDSKATGKYSDGRTPLSYAAENGSEAVVKLLLAQPGVESDSKNDYGRTPLSWAEENGHEAAIRLLLAGDGVDPDDYAGSQKNKHRPKYIAATVAAYAKEHVSEIPEGQVATTSNAGKSHIFFRLPNVDTNNLRFESLHNISCD
jgi:ankyrin repeat protein